MYSVSTSDRDGIIYACGGMCEWLVCIKLCINEYIVFCSSICVLSVHSSMWCYMTYIYIY